MKTIRNGILIRTLFFLIVLNPGFLNAQIFQWAKRMGDTNSQWGTCITADGAGNVYSSGRASGIFDLNPDAGVFNSYAPVYVSKLTSAGNFVWAKCFGAGATQIAAWSMTTDLAGNLYLAGSFRGTPDFDPGPGTYTFSASSIDNEGFLLKLSSAGNFMWAVHYEPAWANANSVVTDASNNVYVTGSFQSTADFNPGAAVFNLTSAGGSDIFIHKLSAAGNLIWAKRIGGAMSDVGFSVAIDATGNLLLTGSFGGTVDFDPGVGVFNLTAASASTDVCIVKLDAAGNFAWARRIGGATSSFCYGKDVNCDASGNVYVAGMFDGTADFDPGAATYNLTTAGMNDFFVCKLTSTGNFTWAKRMGGINNDMVNAMDIDSYGNVYTGGYFSGTVDFDPGAAAVSRTSAGGSQDMFIHKMNSSGNYSWVWTMGSTGNDYIADIALDGSNNLYSTGAFENTVDFNFGSGTYNLTSAGSSDIFIHKIGNTSPLPIELLSFSASQNNTAVDITWQTATETNNDYFTIEKSKDGIDFENAGTINGAGNSTQTLNYNFEDRHPYTGFSCYRLKQTDYDGQFSYSDVVSVKFQEKDLFYLYPNPAKDQVSILWPDKNQVSRQVMIYDMMGRLVYTFNEVGIEKETTTIDMRNFPKGIYTIQLTSENIVEQKKLVVQ
ncbi:MAG: T9SS type A sorting domain-containing protein [Bacteroidota bacterium]